MELHQLRYFAAVARTGNFSRAAEHCHVSQPSLSQQIAKLEKRLRHRLFDRLGRRVVPTDDERLHVEPLWSEPLLLALPPGHRLARRRRITVEDLREERFILLSEMHCLGEQILSFCRASGCQPRIACRSAQIATVQALIALGQG